MGQHNQIDHVLIDKRRHSNVIVRSFRIANSDSDHCLMVKKVKSLSVSKRRKF
jgi:hypothetical protein